MSKKSQAPLVVISTVTPDDIDTDSYGEPKLSPTEQANDAMDDFNHPRYRRALILQALQRDHNDITFVTPSAPASDLDDYQTVHSENMLNFLATAWTRWDALGPEGQDPSGALPPCNSGETPPLVPGNLPLGRDRHQRPSQHVIGQVGYYCTDLCTPIFSSLLGELYWDAAIVAQAVETCLQHKVAYALPTHPGHHAARDSFGGYCYLNHAARAARLLQSKLNGRKVAILDVDYHCGNGTASIFYQDPSVLVVSLHCDPDWDYPFHSGFADQTGAEEGEGTTLHLPLPPGTCWESAYRGALIAAVNRIHEFGAQAVVISLGLDTHEDDPCAIRRAGFCLHGQDYWHMGQTMGALGDLPTVFVQEGGYRMDTIGKAATNVVMGYCA